MLDCQVVVFRLQARNLASQVCDCLIAFRNEGGCTIPLVGHGPVFRGQTVQQARGRFLRIPLTQLPQHIVKCGHGEQGTAKRTAPQPWEALFGPRQLWLRGGAVVGHTRRDCQLCKRPRWGRGDQPLHPVTTTCLRHMECATFFSRILTTAATLSTITA